MGRLGGWWVEEGRKKEIQMLITRLKKTKNVIIHHSISSCTSTMYIHFIHKHKNNK